MCACVCVCACAYERQSTEVYTQPVSLMFASLVFLNSSLGQCLTSSKAETSKTNFVAQIRA